MNTAIGDKLWQDWLAVRHPGQHPASPQGQPQETRMTKLAAARNAVDEAQAQLAAIGPNQLAEAIADAGVGRSLGPDDIRLVLAVIGAIEHGPVGVAPQAMTPPVSFSAAVAPATQVQPQTLA